MMKSGSIKPTLPQKSPLAFSCGVIDSVVVPDGLIRTYGFQSMVVMCCFADVVPFCEIGAPDLVILREGIVLGEDVGNGFDAIFVLERRRGRERGVGAIADVLGNSVDWRVGDETLVVVEEGGEGYEQDQNHRLLEML